MSVADILPRKDLGLDWRERLIATEALACIQTIAGIGVAGERAKAMQDRFENYDLAVNQPEFGTLGFALSRLDTPGSRALLERLTRQVTGETRDVAATPLPIAPRPCAPCEEKRAAAGTLPVREQMDPAPL